MKLHVEMTIQDFLKKKFGRDEEFKEMERQLMLQKKLEAKQKNSNERELDRFEEEHRQKMIKERLEKFREEKKEEFFHGSSQLQQKNIFKGHPTILKDNPKLFNLHGKTKSNMYFK